jgi:hypothetical protein
MGVLGKKFKLDGLKETDLGQNFFRILATHLG